MQLVWTTGILLAIASLDAVGSSAYRDSSSAALSDLHYVPESVPVFPVRRDTTTGEPVSRGRLQMPEDMLRSGNLSQYIFPHSFKKLSMHEVDRSWQCASCEPDLDGNRGTLSMMKMLPITKERLEIVCAWAETQCKSWHACRSLASEMKNGSYDKVSSHFGVEGKFRSFIMMRVINGSLHYDWPWGMERMERRSGKLNLRYRADHYLLLAMVLSSVHVRDCVFFFGGERPSLQWNIPFPIFSFAPQQSYGDFPFPFPEMYTDEFRMHKSAMKKHNFSDSFYSSTPWVDRIAKAAFFSSLDESSGAYNSPESGSTRHLVYDQAALRPDLLEVSFSSLYIAPWDPSSNETTMGYEEGRQYDPTKYKYVVVPMGSGVLSSSGRLAHLLAHSGAVVLMQEAGFNYHFSARLQPWVHYVPLAYNMADLTDKVMWLQSNDGMAQILALNAANFGKSYLRLEDYLCYAAKAMEVLAQLQRGSDVLEPTDPQAFR